MTDKGFEFYTEYCDKIGDDTVKAKKGENEYCMTKASCDGDCKCFGIDVNKTV